MKLKVRISILIVLVCSIFTNQTGAQEIDQQVIDLAHAGDELAKYLVGREVYFGKLDFPDEKLALRWLDESIEENPRNAWFMALASRNREEEEKWLKIGAEKNDQNALTALGLLYLKDKSPEQDKLAFELIQRAYQINPSEEAALLGSLFLEGSAIPQDIEMALKLFDEAIKANNPDGFLQYGHYFKNYAEPLNLKKAIEYYLKASESADLLAPIYLIRTHVENADQNLLNKEQGFFWGIIAQKIGLTYKPETEVLLFVGLTEDDERKIRIKAEAFYQNFHSLN